MSENGQEARRLLRQARAATLATASGGQPFASLATPATAPDGSILLLLSDLSEHTRHLRADPRCAVMVVGAADGPNPQTAPRLTVTGVAAIEPDAGLKRRWVAAHPYAGFYAGFGDFHLWRVPLLGGSFIGGFARAFRLAAADLAPDTDAVAAIAAAEPGIIAHCNGDHPGAVARIAQRHGASEGAWRMVAADVDGCTLAAGEAVLRVAWPAPVASADMLRNEMIRLARA